MRALYHGSGAALLSTRSRKTFPRQHNTAVMPMGHQHGHCWDAHACTRELHARFDDLQASIRSIIREECASQLNAVEHSKLRLVLYFHPVSARGLPRMSETELRREIVHMLKLRANISVEDGIEAAVYLGAGTHTVLLRLKAAWASRLVWEARNCLWQPDVSLREYAGEVLGSRITVEAFIPQGEGYTIPVKPLHHP
jgi:hypothetical protein